MLMRRRQNYSTPHTRAWMHAGWLTLFFIACILFYFYSVGEKKRETDLLAQQLNHLESELASALEKNEDLLLRIESQNDPAWIELVLMAKLGLVPKGQTKVYFEQDE